MISVIIPAYNARKTIDRCLRSLWGQTYRNFEVIIVDDGSTDATWALLNSLKNQESRIRNHGFNPNSLILVHNSVNQGAPAARNRGAKDAKGEYLIFCDADIEMKPDCLEKMRHILEVHPKAAYTYSSFKFGWKAFDNLPFDPERLRRMPYIHTTSLIRRECFPGWDESVKRLQDWDLWLTMLEKGHTGYWISKILFRVVSTKGTMSAWLPSFVYRLSWKLPAVRRYEAAVARIKEKHHLE